MTPINLKGGLTSVRHETLRKRSGAIQAITIHLEGAHGEDVSLTIPWKHLGKTSYQLWKAANVLNSIVAGKPPSEINPPRWGLDDPEDTHNDDGTRKVHRSNRGREEQAAR